MILISKPLSRSGGFEIKITDGGVMFGHQRLYCYNLCLGVAKRMPELIGSWPSGSGYLVDQLKRALSSVILNIAEGNGRKSIKERRRFFDIAIGSAAEVSSIFDVARAYGYITEPVYEELQSELLQVVRMLYKLK